MKSIHQAAVELIPATDKMPVGLSSNGQYYDHRAFEILNEPRFAKYLIGQNVSKSKSFSLQTPSVKKARDLVTRKVYTSFPIDRKPRTAVVLEVLE